MQVSRRLERHGLPHEYGKTGGHTRRHALGRESLPSSCHDTRASKERALNIAPTPAQRVEVANAAPGPDTPYTPSRRHPKRLCQILRGRVQSSTRCAKPSRDRFARPRDPSRSSLNNGASAHATCSNAQISRLTSRASLLVEIALARRRARHPLVQLDPDAVRYPDVSHALETLFTASSLSSASLGRETAEISSSRSRPHRSPDPQLHASLQIHQLSTPGPSLIHLPNSLAALFTRRRYF
ncbi:hypothetical protein EXIGLDRAFT_736444 [Exidia glandulosa HHB12029]|uniref:Uncharacterized protein n=1 Tax=Exidia glandulosa HHB12029 TaxID=1314781 RepID=A0A165JDK7_EXIGL|nr:hypothetical protein EXIGLDRAFT_736444 [Exidia glandulosa HHB12029]